MVGPVEASAGFLLTVDLIDGVGDGARRTTARSWPGSWFDFPRSRLRELRDEEELKRSGLYILTGTNEDNESRLYIGETDEIGARLEQHRTGKTFWDRAYILTRKSVDDQLNKAEIRYLEAALIRQAVETNRVKLDNGTRPPVKGLNAAEARDADGFLRTAITILPLLGILAFTPAVPDKSSSAGGTSNILAEEASSSGTHFYLTMKGVKADAIYNSSGFTVLAGAQSRRKPKVMLNGYRLLRDKLIEEGTMALDPALDSYLFTRPYTFRNPSPAAAVVIGGSVNGKLYWKTATGEPFGVWELNA